MEEQLTWREGHPSFLPFAEGTKVLLKILTDDRSVEQKFAPRYSGPYEVIRLMPGGVSYQLRGKGKLMRAHHSHLKLWAEPPSYLKEYFECHNRVKEYSLEVCHNLEVESRKGGGLVNVLPSDEVGQYRRLKQKTRRKIPYETDFDFRLSAAEFSDELICDSFTGNVREVGKNFIFVLWWF